MVVIAAHRAFCAVCIDGTDRLARRQLEPGGPRFWVCGNCHEDPVEPPRPREIPPGRSRVMSDPAIEILTASRHLGWATSTEIRERLQIPGAAQNRKALDRFSAMISRLHRDGFLERRETPGLWPDYRLSELGAVALGIAR